MSLARQLAQEAIPVEFLVEVDAPWFRTSVVPSNVKRAANFYERGAWWMPIFLGTAHARAEQPAKTVVLDNIRIPKVGHLMITKRPQIRERVVAEVIETLERHDAQLVQSVGGCE